MVRNLVVEKRPRSDPILDKPINFPSLADLRLDLIEIKKKLKPGLPLVPIKSKPKPKPDDSQKELKFQDKPSDEEPKKKPEESKKEKSKTKPKIDDSKSKTSEDLEKDLVEDDEDPEDSIAELAEGSDEDEDIKEEDEGKQSKDTQEPEEDDPYAGMSPEEREAKEKEEYMWRFRILKRQYKNVKVQEFNEHSDLSLMKSTYNRTVKELYLDDSVETYRTYLIGSFIVTEFVCTQWVGIDMSGFTRHQGMMLGKYDRLLIELGEKSYGSWGGSLPVEVRLIGMVLMQAGMFYLGKIIAEKVGSNVAELFRGITGQPPSEANSQSSSPTEQPKKKMKGPSIKAEDIKKMNTADEVEDE